MRSIEDKGCLNLNNGLTQEIPGSSFEFQSSSRTSSHNRTSLGKPAPSKWDDAQKWLVNLSVGDKNLVKASPRSSNADDRRLIGSHVPKKDYSSGDEEGENGFSMETKNVDCCNDDSSIWRMNTPVITMPKSIVRSISVRDMGTEMTPIASQEPSRTATPIRACSPNRSPISSGQLSPVSFPDRPLALENGLSTGNPRASGESENKANGELKKLNPLETRAMAWDEAERAKYMARYKREEVKIQAWENHQKRKAEMETRKVEVKAERLKSRAQEKYTNKIASTKRIAEEKRANAETKLNEKVVKTSERADYIRRTGHLPSFFSIKLPSFCC